jgi:hypothetical protein
VEDRGRLIGRVLRELLLQAIGVLQHVGHGFFAQCAAMTTRQVSHESVIAFMLGLLAVSALDSMVWPRSPWLPTIVERARSQRLRAETRSRCSR